MSTAASCTIDPRLPSAIRKSGARSSMALARSGRVKQLLYMATATAMVRGVECAKARELRTFPVRVAAQQLEQQSHIVLSQLHEIPLAVFLCPVDAQRVCVCRRKLRWRETEPPACFRLGCCTTAASVSQGGASPNPQSRSYAKYNVLFRTTNVYCEYKESLHSSVHRQYFVQQSDIAMRQPSNVNHHKQRQ
jgi:hypothetical protein